MAFVVVYDSCVLYSAPLRDLLMRMALADLYRAKWTRKIHEEWIRNLNKNRGIPVKILERVANLMDAHVRDALVEDYQKYEQLFVLPDPDDHHVLAAAIASGAKLIVTFNQKDLRLSLPARQGCGRARLGSCLLHGPCAPQVRGGSKGQSWPKTLQNLGQRPRNRQGH